MGFGDPHGCIEEHDLGGSGETFARWLSEQTGRPVRFAKVPPGDEQIIEERDQRDQRELDAVPSFLALPNGNAASDS